MKPLLVSLVFTLSVSTTGLGQPASDSIATSKSFNANTSPLNAEIPLMEMVNPSLYGKVTYLLGDKGVAFQNRMILAVGFESDAMHSQKRLVIITLEGNNEPQKYTIETSPEFYGRVFAKPDSIPQIAAGPQVPQNSSDTVRFHNRQDGRVYFMLNTTLKSLWVYPAGLAQAFPDINGQVLAGLSLLSLGGSLYGSYLFTKDRELGYGRVEFMNFGGDVGGLFYPNLLSAFLSSVSGGDAPQVAAWTGIFGYPAGIYLGSKVRFAGNFQYGNASIMTSMSKFGFLYGFMLPLYFTIDPSSDQYVACATGLTMALVPAGFFIGYKLVGNNDFSSGRSVIITTSGILGALTGALIPTLWESYEKEVIATTTLVGHMVGTYVGFHYMENRTYSFGQGLFISASSAVGVGLAEAFPLIGKSSSRQAYIIIGIAGAWGGAAIGELLSRSLFERTPHDTRLSSSVSIPGIWELPVMLAMQNLHPHKPSASGDIRENIATARLLEIRF